MYIDIGIKSLCTIRCDTVGACLQFENDALCVEYVGEYGPDSRYPERAPKARLIDAPRRSEPQHEREVVLEDDVERVQRNDVFPCNTIIIA